ncbi:MAG: hypothetical protein A2143_02940 [Gallionellales bacterium RBG_16_57_15]|nr:MAG: hypothetical protein A2143_02940 [Gallionellales bacterium RBG_16_57_15]
MPFVGTKKANEPLFNGRFIMDCRTVSFMAWPPLRMLLFLELALKPNIPPVNFPVKQAVGMLFYLRISGVTC